MLARFPKVNTLRVTGGTTKSVVWMQMLADLTGLTIELPQVEESGALGAAVIAMVGSGEYQSIEQALAQCHQEIITVVPNNEHFAAYQNKYQHYLRFIEAIKSYEGIA
jgi:L-xylulokinase